MQKHQPVCATAQYVMISSFFSTNYEFFYFFQYLFGLSVRFCTGTEICEYSVHVSTVGSVLFSERHYPSACANVIKLLT